MSDDPAERSRAQREQGAYVDALEYEKLADGHSFRAGLNESLAQAAHLPEAERTLYREIVTLHGALAAKYRALAAVIRKT